MRRVVPPRRFSPLSWTNLADAIILAPIGTGRLPRPNLGCFPGPWRRGRLNRLRAITWSLCLPTQQRRRGSRSIARRCPPRRPRHRRMTPRRATGRGRCPCRRAAGGLRRRRRPPARDRGGRLAVLVRLAAGRRPVAGADGAGVWATGGGRAGLRPLAGPLAGRGADVRRVDAPRPGGRLPAVVSAGRRGGRGRRLRPAPRGAGPGASLGGGAGVGVSGRCTGRRRQTRTKPFTGSRPGSKTSSAWPCRCC